MNPDESARVRNRTLVNLQMSPEEQRNKQLTILFNIFWSAKTGNDKMKEENMMKSFFIIFNYIQQEYETVLYRGLDIVVGYMDDFWRAYEQIKKMRFKSAKMKPWDIEDTSIGELLRLYFDIINKFIDDVFKDRRNNMAYRKGCKSYIILYILISIIRGIPYEMYRRRHPKGRTFVENFVTLNYMKTEAVKYQHTYLNLMVHLFNELRLDLENYEPCSITETL